MAGKTALLVIDTLASALRDDSFVTCAGKPVLPDVRRLLDCARSAGAFGVHVVEDFHQTKYPPGSPVWSAYQIHPDVAPRGDELVVRQQCYDAFLGNGLHERLTSEGVKTVVVAGIAPPWCVDTAVRARLGSGTASSSRQTPTTAATGRRHRDRSSRSTTTRSSAPASPR